MSQVQPKKLSNFQLRAKTPLYFRYAAVAILALTIVIVGVGFYRNYGRKEFRMMSQMPVLSKDVTATVMGYERRESDGQNLKYYVKADRATTYSDNHQELENAYFEIYDKDEKDEKGAPAADKIKADKAIYIPADNKNFNAYLLGNVNIETRDGLKVKADQFHYDKAAEVANTDDPVEFSRENVSGKSVGARVFTKDKKLELLSQVEINADGAQKTENNEMANANLQNAHIVAGHAIVEQLAEKIYLEQNVNINLQPKTAQGTLSQPTDIRAEKVTAYFTDKKINKLEMAENVQTFQKPTAQNPKYTKTRSDNAAALFENELKNLQMDGNVEIETTNNNPKPTKMKSQQAVYDKPSDTFDLKTNVEIVTVEDEKPTTIRAQEANYQQSAGKITLNGAAEILQPDVYTKGDAMTADLYPTKKIKNSYIRGNAYLKQTTPARTTEVSAAEMSVNYNENQQIQNADAKNQTTATLTPASPQDYNKVTMTAPNAMNLAFANNVLNQMQTDGRTAIVMSAPPNKNDASNKKLTADTVKTTFDANGRDLARAEAVGNAELYVEPLQAKADNYKTNITAPRFDCDFYAGNNAKSCVGQAKTKTVMTPMVAAENHGTRTLTADKVTTNFNQGTQDVERLDADGSAKFSELDRNGISNQMVYTASDGVVRLRGGEPTVWNSQARAKSAEIDWDTKNQKSFLRGKVATTYYSQKQTGGATPFGKTNAPVFITSDQAQFNHQEEVGIYQGNARAWQDNNYVRADTLILQQKTGRLDGAGKVQSLLYNAERKEDGKTIKQPVFAASDKIAYTDGNKQLHYEDNVDIRQGTDRIVAGVADVFMDQNNEMKQTVAQNNVVLTQPERRATGSWVQYTTADDTAILRGNPATVADAENGTSQGSQITVLMRENRVVNQGSTKANTSGRTRTIYKVKPQ